MHFHVSERLLLLTILICSISASAAASADDAAGAPDDGPVPAGFSEQPPAPQVECKSLPIHSFRSKLTNVDTNQFKVTCKGINAVAVKQREDTWCWAACAEMLDHYRGIKADQAQIVERIKDEAPSDDKNQTANQMEIWLAMNPEMLGEYNRRRNAWHKPNQIDLGIHFNLNLKTLFSMTEKVSSDMIVEELSTGNPLLLGMRGGVKWGQGHIVLVSGATYSRLDPSDPPKYRYVGVAPPRSPNRNTLTFNDLFQGLVNKAQGNDDPHYSILSMDIIDPQPDKDPHTGEYASQFSTLTDADLVDHVDFFIGRTAAAKKLKAYMQTALPTPAEMAQQQAQAGQQQPNLPPANKPPAKPPSAKKP
jgi:hypothetical protein